MSRMLVVEFNCNGDDCRETASEPYQENYGKECDDLEKSGWAVVNGNSEIKGLVVAGFDCHYCPKCKPCCQNCYYHSDISSRRPRWCSDQYGGCEIGTWKHFERKKQRKHGNQIPD